MRAFSPKTIFVFIFSVWILMGFFNVIYNAGKSVVEIKEWGYLADKEKREKIFGKLYNYFVFIGQHTEENDQILIFSKDVRNFYLSIYYLYPRKINTTDNQRELDIFIKKKSYEYIALDNNKIDSRQYNLIASSSGKFFLYKRNE